jgi:hypothetical protein
MIYRPEVPRQNPLELLIIHFKKIKAVGKNRSFLGVDTSGR